MNGYGLNWAYICSFLTIAGIAFLRGFDICLIILKFKDLGTYLDT